MLLFSDYGPLLAGWSAYVAATASPGPAIMTIIETAVRCGRRSGLALALGVLSGSLTWALLAVFGISGLIRAEPRAITLVQVAGGTYLLWLGWTAATRALSTREPKARQIFGSDRLARHYLRGYALHLTNPKAIMAWITLTSLAIPANAATDRTVLFLGGCIFLGLLIFTGFALLFSRPAVHAAYLKHRRPIEAAVAVFFSAAGLMLLKGAL